ncbi:hypothetical protein BDY19DRAFT_224367 [Irpex rosettiformis]|uniref:Uncharacterized protein n=1 Tax=Irpex rosettiformis TaxID=378272 RepID=A0ACB8U0V2_9APHY|nr:hypothetical protein BDY19DRAFT_224367 [Irpex rosettiformis]
MILLIASIVASKVRCGTTESLVSDTYIGTTYISFESDYGSITQQFSDGTYCMSHDYHGVQCTWIRLLESNAVTGRCTHTSISPRFQASARAVLFKKFIQSNLQYDMYLTIRTTNHQLTTYILGYGLEFKQASTNSDSNIYHGDSLDSEPVRTRGQA